MAATIITSNFAGAFRLKNGETAYMLLEEYYAFNERPRILRWGPLDCGSFAGCLPRIFLAASQVAGGMIKARSGYIKPETYISRWRNTLRRPVLIDEAEIELYVDPANPYGGTVYLKDAEHVARILEDYGLAFDSGSKLQLKLGKHGEAFIALYSTGMVHNFVRYIEPFFGLAGDSSLAPAEWFKQGRAVSPPKGAHLKHIPRVLRLSEWALIVEEGGHPPVVRYDGSFRPPVERGIMDWWQLELKIPGIYRALIPAAAEALRDAPAADPIAWQVAGVSDDFRSRFAPGTPDTIALSDLDLDNPFLVQELAFQFDKKESPIRLLPAEGIGKTTCAA